MKITSKRKIIIISFICLIVVGITVWLFCFCMDNSNFNDEEVKFKEKLSLEVIRANYNDLVKLNDKSILYLKNNDKYEMVGTVYGNIEVRLDSEYEIVDEYFKILNSDYYVKYDSVSKIDGLMIANGEYKYYKNYVPYNENVLLGSNSKLYVDDDSYYEISDGSYPIIIKDDNRYGIEFNNRLVYVNEDDVKDIVSSNNTSENFADSVSVLNYHYVVSPDEMKSCAQSICLLEEKFDEQIKYLKDNNYYGVSLRDLELFIDGKIQLPERSVSITIDDGWRAKLGIEMLTKYYSFFHRIVR